MPLVINSDLSIIDAADTSSPTAVEPTSALQGLKNDSAATASNSPIVDEQTKMAGTRTSSTTPIEVSKMNPYYTQKVGTTGMTQAQLDAQENAIAVATLTGGTTKRNPAGGLTVVKPVAAGLPVMGFSDNTGSGATTNIDILKASLRGLGFTSAIIDSSTSFLVGLLKDGLDLDNATEIFLNSKEYTLKNGTKVTSPFYTEYGYLNEGLVVPKTASDLFNTVEGYKGVIDKYKLSSKYLTKDSLQKYIKNDVTVKDLSERAASAELRAIEADPFQVKALMQLGYIGTASDLKDFYMDSKIGQEQLELNRQTGVFTAEALRRAKSGVLSSENQLSQFKQLTASLAAKGYSEAQISQLAGTGFENIAEAINPITKLAQIYDKAGGTLESNAALTENLQTELLSEEFKGTASEKRKRYSELERSAFQGSSGRANVRPSSVAGIL